MIRGVGLLALTGAIGLGLARSAPTSAGTPEAATPAAPYAGVEMPGEVPISLLIRNDGRESDRLLGGSTPLAQRVEAHRTRFVRERREMQTVPDGIVIPAGATVMLEPGSEHLMMVGLRAGLVQGRSFPLSLAFSRTGQVTVTVRVRRKVDAAGITPFPAVVAGDLTLWLASAPPASPATPRACGSG